MALRAGGSLSVQLPAADGPRNIYPIINQGTAASGSTRWTAGTGPMGTTRNGGAGAQGITDAPGILFPFALQRAVGSGTAAIAGTTDGDVAVDALLVQPQISTGSVSGSRGQSTVYVSAAESTTVRQVPVPAGFVTEQRQYDSSGQAVPGKRDDAGARSGRVTVAPGGFTVVTLVRK